MAVTGHLQKGNIKGHGERTLEELNKENDDLQDALLKQWLDAHSEHCRWEWPHADVCCWPPPSVLRIPVELGSLNAHCW